MIKHILISVYLNNSKTIKHYKIQKKIVTKIINQNTFHSSKTTQKSAERRK